MLKLGKMAAKLYHIPSKVLLTSRQIILTSGKKQDIDLLSVQNSLFHPHILNRRGKKLKKGFRCPLQHGAVNSLENHPLEVGWTCTVWLETLIQNLLSAL